MVSERKYIIIYDEVLNMGAVYSFLKKSGVFFLINDNNGIPTGRPFDTIIEDENDLIIGVSRNNDLYNQLKRNSRIQLVALDNVDKKWIRVNGFAYEEFDENSKQRLMESSEFLKHHPHMAHEVAIFRVEILDYKIYQ